MTGTPSVSPAGFGPLFRSSPFLDLLGPVLGKGEREGLVVGLRVSEHHCNSRGTLHGGVIATLADVALGYVTAYSGDSPRGLTTASLSIDYTGTARPGDWIEVHVETFKVGSRLAFANCYVRCGETQVARASAVFAVSGE